MYNEEKQSSKIIKDFNSDDVNIILEEYKTLRKEILDNAKHQHDIILFMYTGITALFTIAFEQNSMDVLMITFLFLIPLRIRHLFYQECIFKISAYISTKIETRLKYLHWESTNHYSEVEDSTSKSPFAISAFHYYIPTVISITITIISLIKGSIYCIVSIIFSIYILSLDYKCHKENINVLNYYKNNWQKINIE